MKVQQLTVRKALVALVAGIGLAAVAAPSSPIPPPTIRR